MAEYIDRNDLLAEIDKLKLSPWFNRGKNQKADYQHCMYLERKEGVEVVTDLCIKEQPTIDVIEKEKIDNAIKEMNSMPLGLVMNCDEMRDYCVEILKRNIGE